LAVKSIRTTANQRISSQDEFSRGDGPVMCVRERSMADARLPLVTSLRRRGRDIGEVEPRAPPLEALEMARAQVAVPPSGRLDCGSGGYRFSPLGWRGLDTETRAGTRRPLRLHLAAQFGVGEFLKLARRPTFPTG